MTNRWIMTAIAVGGAFLIPPHVVHARPVRVVSINPCADAVLRHVADPRQIAAISHYSHDPRASSVPIDWARGFPVTYGGAEEVLRLRPDVVLAGGHVARPTMLMLQRLRVKVVPVPVPTGIGESLDQIDMIARAVGHADRGRALRGRIVRALDAARAGRGARVPAMIWQAGGMVPGRGSVADDLLTLTGFHNVSADFGLSSWDVVPLERMLARPPRILLTALDQADAQDRTLRHRALRHLGRRVAIYGFAPGLLHCAGPSLIPAAARLAYVRARVR